jgi:hypothetical protein
LFFEGILHQGIIEKGFFSEGAFKNHFIVFSCSIMQMELHIRLRYILLSIVLFVIAFAIVDNRKAIWSAINIFNDEVEVLLYEEALEGTDSLNVDTLVLEKEYAKPLSKYSYLDESELLQIELPDADVARVKIETVFKQTPKQAGISNVQGSE